MDMMVQVTTRNWHATAWMAYSKSFINVSPQLNGGAENSGHEIWGRDIVIAVTYFSSIIICYISDVQLFA